MKKHFLYLALMAGMTLGFTACSGDDDNEAKAPELPTTKPLALAKQAVELEFTADLTAPFEKIILTETGKALLSRRELAVTDTRATASDDYFIGTYKVNGNVYTVYDNVGNVYCTLNITPNAAGTATDVTIKIGDEEEVVAKADAEEKNEESMTNTLCRDWTIVYTDLQYEADFAAVGKIFGLDKDYAPNSLNDVLRYAKTQADIDEELEEGMAITDVIFTRSGSFILLFENGKCFVGGWQWDQKVGYITYKWENEDMKTIFENENDYGDATAVFSTGTLKKVTYYTLTLKSDNITNKKNGKDEKYKVSITFFLREK